VFQADGRSEKQPRAKLDLPLRRLCRGAQAEAPVADDRGRRIERRVIEYVKELGTELHVESLEHVRVLDERRVGIPPRRASIDVARQIARSRLYVGVKVGVEDQRAAGALVAGLTANGRTPTPFRLSKPYCSETGRAGAKSWVGKFYECDFRKRFQKS
jgi:hypothetical protein